MNTIAGSIDACMSIDVFMKIEEPNTALAGEDGETIGQKIDKLLEMCDEWIFFTLNEQRKL